MMTGYIAGAFPIVPPNPGQTALVQVFAEDHDTNNIESALPMPNYRQQQPERHRLHRHLPEPSVRISS